MNKMYNEEIKLQFLNEKYPDTQDTVKYVFYYSYLNESVLGKDLYDFNLEECGSVIANGNPKSTNVAASRFSVISQYISWSIGKNLRKSEINPLQGEGEEWYSQFVTKKAKEFLSKQEIDEIIKGLVNYQDKVIIRLLFEGVYGYESSELRNLKFDDIDANGDVTLYDDKKGERIINLDKDTIEMIQIADFELRYENKNGQSLGKAPTSDLLPSVYVLKNANKSRSTENERISQPVLMKRVKMISEIFELPDITPKSIWRSGQLYMAYLSYINTGKINYDEIGDRYALSKVVNNGYEYYNVSYLEKNYLNMDTIVDLYDVPK